MGTNDGGWERQRRGARLTTYTILVLVVVLIGAVAWSVQRYNAKVTDAEVAASSPPGTYIPVNQRDAATTTAPGANPIDPAVSEPTTVAPAEVVDTTMPHAPGTPTRTAAPSATPLGVPAALPGTGPHAFTSLGPDGLPVSFDPCRPIPVVVNSRTAPPGADALLDAALAEVSTWTGLQFVREGATDEAPSKERAPFQPDRYGDRWAPLLVAWSDPTEYTFDGDAVGQAGSMQYVYGEQGVFVTGQVVLDGVTLSSGEGYEDRAFVQAVVMHELGHAVGLTHVDDPTQLMNPNDNRLVGFGNGDKAGLSQLAQRPCIAFL